MAATELKRVGAIHELPLPFLIPQLSTIKLSEVRLPALLNQVFAIT